MAKAVNKNSKKATRVRLPINVNRNVVLMSEAYEKGFSTDKKANKRLYLIVKDIMYSTDPQLRVEITFLQGAKVTIAGVPFQIDDYTK